MKIAFILFDQMTMLDFVGFYDVITRMDTRNGEENVSWHFCSNKEEITDDRGMTVKINHVYPDLSEYDMVFIPSGFSTRQLRYDSEFISWIKTAIDVEYKVAVCTGSLILGAAGFLHEKKATTNPSAYELLAPYCAEVVNTRYIKDGNIFTGGGVSASIDLGLYVVESLTDANVAKQIQVKMDYPYY